MNEIFEWVTTHPFYAITGVVMILMGIGLFRFVKARFEEEYDEE